MNAERPLQCVKQAREGIASLSSFAIRTASSSQLRDVLFAIWSNKREYERPLWAMQLPVNYRRLMEVQRTFGSGHQDIQQKSRKVPLTFSGCPSCPCCKVCRQCVRQTALEQSELKALLISYFEH